MNVQLYASQTTVFTLHTQQRDSVLTQVLNLLCTGFEEVKEQSTILGRQKAPSAPPACFHGLLKYTGSHLQIVITTYLHI